MSDIKMLDALGFERSAVWQFDSSSPICRINRNADKTKVLYVFVENDRVKYIGKTTRTFSQRMYGYQNPGPTQRTNIRIKQKIIDSLSIGGTISVYILIPKDEILYHNIPLNIAAGLEDPLIEKLRPEWNMIGKT